MKDFLTNRLSPFAYKNFQKFFLTQSVSLVGVWAFDLARAWIIIDSLGRASELGLVLMAGAIPGLFFSFYGGVLADRKNVKNMMMLTKAILGVFSLFLAFMVEFVDIKLWHLIVFSVLQGAVIATDGPTFQSLVAKLVPKKDLQQAIAINSTNFHFSRALGPIIAGILMSIHGPSLVFLFDGLSYLGLLFVLRTFKTETFNSSSSNSQETLDNSSQPPLITSLKEGLAYFFTNKCLRYLILQLFTTLFFMFPLLTVVMRTFIKEKFQVDSQEFASVFSISAIGAMAGSLFFMMYKPKKPIKVLFIAIPLCVIFLLLTTKASSLFYLKLSIAITGFFMFLCYSALTVSLNLYIEDSFRGRMGSLVTFGFMSFGPLLSYPLGALSDYLGYTETLQYFAIGFALTSLTIYFLFYSPPDRLVHLTTSQHPSKHLNKQDKTI